VLDSKTLFHIHIIVPFIVYYNNVQSLEHLGHIIEFFILYIKAFWIKDIEV
jgi:hypothetical protein